MFFHKFTKREGHKVLAVCDKSLLGEVLSDDKFELNVKKGFYGEEKISKEELIEKASESTIINAIGNKAVSTLKSEGFFDGNKILKVDGVSHAQMVKI